VAGRVDEVQLVGLAVLGRVRHPHGLRLDGNSPLALQVHGVENLASHVAIGDGMGGLQDAIGQRRLAMVDVGDDAEVPNM
jgi:hypothetical protein